MVFFDGLFQAELPAEDIPRLPVAFKLWLSHSAPWPVVGRQPVAAENGQEPYFFEQDPISGGLSLYHSTFANYERPATLAECRDLECAAVWDHEHVVMPPIGRTNGPRA
jgi:hypothetical protein